MHVARTTGADFTLSLSMAPSARGVELTDVSAYPRGLKTFEDAGFTQAELSRVECVFLSRCPGVSDCLLEKEAATRDCR